MRRVCGHGDVDRRLSIERIRVEISCVWDPTTYKAFLAMLTGLGNPEACFFSEKKAVFMENKGYNDLRRAAEGGHDAAAYLYAILIYRDNGGAAADNTAKRYMRRVASGGSTTSRWMSNEGVFLCARRPHVRSTPRLGAFWVNRYRLRHRCAAISRAQAMAAAATWKKDGFEFLCFAVKTVGCAAKW
jgi:TPR repeat protein